jgi:hypothetical protein
MSVPLVLFSHQAGPLPHPGNQAGFPNITLSSPRIQFRSFAGQDKAHAADQGSRSAQCNRTDPCGQNVNCPSNAIPAAADMKILAVGSMPTSNCNIQFSHPGTGLQRSIPVERSPKLPTAQGTTWTAATGALCLPHDLPVKVTVSGWGQASSLGHQLDNGYWKDKVFEMCDAIGHSLEVNSSRDQTVRGHRPGTFQASHVEKQLLAYVFFKHIFQANTAATASNEMDWIQTIQDLSPADESRRVIIYVDRMICSDCWQCLQKFCNFAWISVTVHVRPQL